MEDDMYQWNTFVEIGEKIHRLRGVLREHQGKFALQLAKSLRDKKFVFTQERYTAYSTLFQKILKYVDFNAEKIQEAAKLYFFAKHVRAGYEDQDFYIEFLPKEHGIHTGFICNVFNTSTKSRESFCIKSHQYGPTEDNISSLKPVDAKELFVYELLHAVGMGPEVHFVTSATTKQSVYIAIKIVNLIHLSDLNTVTASQSAILQIDLISRLLCLNDCATNSSNCGQVDNRPMIVDFEIKTRPDGYFKNGIVEEFLNGTNETVYLGLMRVLTTFAERDMRVQTLASALQQWNIMENIDQVGAKIRQYMAKSRSVTFFDDLDVYLADIKRTTELLFGHFIGLII